MFFEKDTGDVLLSSVRIYVSVKYKNRMVLKQNLHITAWSTLCGSL